MRPPSHVISKNTYNPSKERPMFKETHPLFGTKQFPENNGYVRSLFDTALIPRDHGTLPLNQIIRKCELGLGPRYNHSIVGTKMFGPLSKMTMVDNERVKGNRDPQILVSTMK